MFDENLLENQLENLPSQAITQLADLIASNLRKEEPRQTITFKELFDLYYEYRVKSVLKNSQNHFYFYKKHGSRWADIQIHEIKRRDVQGWVDQLGESSPTAARKALVTLRAIINWGMRREHIPAMENPCNHVETLKDRLRRRFILPSELQSFEDALEPEPQIYQDFFHICLLTGGRKSNVRSMRWDEIDFDLATWTIPDSKFKTGDEAVIPLTEWPLKILQRRKEAGLDAEWVFPAGKPNSKTKHINCVKRAWARILNRSGLKNLRIHDLRRTLASYMAIEGNNTFVIAQMLGHKDMRSVARYARLDVSTVRKAAETVSTTWQRFRDATVQARQLKAYQSADSLATANDQNASEKITRADEIVIQAKIIKSLALSKTNRTKKDFYRKIGSSLGVDKMELERILASMVLKGLIEKVYADNGFISYCLIK